MNNDAVADLKQFIRVTVSRQIADLRLDIGRIEQRLDRVEQRLGGVEQRVDSIDHKIHDLSSAVAEALDVANEANGKQFRNHERRITRLEHKTR